MSRILFVPILGLILNTSIFAQYYSNKSDSKNYFTYINHLITFDDLFKNPANAGNSESFNLNIIGSWGGYYGFYGIVSVDNYFEGFNSGLGIRIETVGRSYSSIELPYAYSFKINDLTWKIGCSLGYVVWKNIPMFSTTPTIKHHEFIYNFGTQLEYKAHTFGLAYDKNVEYLSNTIMLDYKTKIKLSENYSLLPELFSYLNKDESFLAVLLDISFKDKFSFGYLNNSLKSSAIIFSYSLKSILFFGVQVDYLYENNINFISYTGNLALRFK